MYEFTLYQVRDVMTSDPVTVRADTLLGKIEDIFKEHDFNGLPVVDDHGNLLGMITKLDLLKAFDFSEKLKIPAYATIRNYQCFRIMSVNPMTFRPESPLTRVLHSMIETGFKSFPVITGGKLIAIIAREDIITALNLAARGISPERIHRNE